MSQHSVTSFKTQDYGEISVPMSSSDSRDLSKTQRKAMRRAPRPDSFPQTFKVSEEAIQRHSAGTFNPTRMRTKLAQKRAAVSKQIYEKGVEATARAELLNQEEGGFLEAGENEFTHTISQREICDAVDLASATKHFNLCLESFGPYSIDYTTNGRYLALGGRKGHVAALDWMAKKLQTENNVMERIRAIRFLHTDTMIAVAQKHYVYIYDNAGTELHCIKTMNENLQLEFLQKHFLLAGGNKNGWLSWLDVSVGTMVTSFNTKQGSLNTMCQNRTNGVIHTGHNDGTVSLWAPSMKEPLARVVGHTSLIQGIDVDTSGKYMLTTGAGRCKIWDLRMLQPVSTTSISPLLSRAKFSDTLLVACAIGNMVQIFKDLTIGTCRKPYLSYKCSGVVSDLQFVPFEDVLGIGHNGGFTSILVPGSGQSNVDLLRANPYETKKQRKEREVKQLLEKIPSDMICLDPRQITRIDSEALADLEQRRRSKLFRRHRTDEDYKRDIKFARRETDGREPETKPSSNESQDSKSQKKITGVLSRFKR